MIQLLNFILFDPSSRLVLIGVVFLCVATSLLGTFTFLQRKSLLGDVISHAALPGICLSYMIFHSKSTYLLSIGAFFSGLFSNWLVKIIPKHSKIKEDAALAIVLSTMFGIGIILLTKIQQSGSASQAGLSNFLLGKVASMTENDMWSTILICGVSIIITILFFKELKVVSFDPVYAKIIGVNVPLIQTLLSFAVVTVIVVGVRIVGVLLMSAMLITPVAAARYWTDSLSKLLLISMVISIISGFLGSYVSYLLPSMSTGPWIVVFMTFCAYFSFLFSLKKGYLRKMIEKRLYRNKMLSENILKFFYEESLKNDNINLSIDYNTILRSHPMPKTKLQSLLRKSCVLGFLEERNKWYYLTKKGFEEGKRVYDLHIMWETYLKNYLKIKADHVHDDAESIEHIISPEIERDLRLLIKKDL